MLNDGDRLLDRRITGDRERLRCAGDLDPRLADRERDLKKNYTLIAIEKKL